MHFDLNILDFKSITLLQAIMKVSYKCLIALLELELLFEGTLSLYAFPWCLYIPGFLNILLMPIIQNLFQQNKVFYPMVRIMSWN